MKMARKLKLAQKKEKLSMENAISKIDNFSQNFIRNAKNDFRKSSLFIDSPEVFYFLLISFSILAESSLANL
jgi:hypothetical protein